MTHNSFVSLEFQTGAPLSQAARDAYLLEKRKQQDHNRAPNSIVYLLPFCLLTLLHSCCLGCSSLFFSIYFFSSSALRLLFSPRLRFCLLFSFALYPDLLSTARAQVVRPTASSLNLGQTNEKVTSSRPLSAKDAKLLKQIGIKDRTAIREAKGLYANEAQQVEFHIRCLYLLFTTMEQHVGRHGRGRKSDCRPGKQGGNCLSYGHRPRD